MPYNATLDDDDMFFRKSNVSGDDEAVKWGDMKQDFIDVNLSPFIDLQGNDIAGRTDYALS